MGKLFSKTDLALRQEILSGKLVSGESLIEQTLANRFKVGRTLQDCLAQANLSEPVVKKSKHESTRSVSREASDELENRLHTDQSFHRLLAESSGNPQLADLLEQVFSKMAFSG